MSHGLLADNVDTTLAGVLYSCIIDAVFSEVHNQWASRSWHAICGSSWASCYEKLSKL